jgi:hypothetical protein
MKPSTILALMVIQLVCATTAHGQQAPAKAIGIAVTSKLPRAAQARDDLVRVVGAIIGPAVSAAPGQTPAGRPVVTVGGRVPPRWVLIDAEAIGNAAVRYTVRVRRPAGELVRGGLAAPTELPQRVARDALLGLMTERPGPPRPPRVAVMPAGNAARAHAAVVAGALRRRGWSLVDDDELALAMRLAGGTGDAARPQKLRSLLVADAVVVVDASVRPAGRVLLTATVHGTGRDQGVALSSPADRVEAYLAALARRIELGGGDPR